MPSPSRPPSLTIWNETQLEFIAGLEDNEQARYLFLEEHPEFTGFWLVNGLTDDYFFDLEDIIGSYRTVSPVGLDKFMAAANEAGYHVGFIDSPQKVLDYYAHLNDPPPVSINSDMPNTVNGFLPWQAQAINFLKDISGKAIHSTGTGKTAVATGLVKYHTYDICVYVCKAHNKIGTQRKLKSLGDIDSIILDASTAQKRADMYAELYCRLEDGESLVLITNYEKFREDEEAFKLMFEGRDLLVIYDEMPTKLSNRDTLLYRAVLRCFWKTQTDAPNSTPNPLTSKHRVKSYRAYELTATPIENDPEGDFNCLPEGTEIESSTPVERAFKVAWKGPLVKFITASGAQLTIGPNHPVLTNRGWVDAQFLNKGDNVIRSTVQGSFGVKDFNQNPTLIENLFDSFWASSDTLRTKRASRFEFHGDGKFFKSEVYIVDVNGLLGNELNPNVSEQVSKSIFAFAHPDREISFSSVSALNLCFDSIFSTQPYSSPRSNKTTIIPTRKPRLADFNSSLFQSVRNQLLADVQFVSDESSGLVFINVKPFNEIQINRDSPCSTVMQLDTCTFQPSTDSVATDSHVICDEPHGLSESVTFDEIVNIESFDWEGHVYDLSTSNGIYYANGMVVSNCTRLIDPTVFGSVREFRDEYVSSFNYFDENKPESWHNLDKMALKQAHVTHVVNKKDPDVAKFFPKDHYQPIIIDWDARDRKVYDMLVGKAVGMVNDFEEANVLALIGVLQMMCDMPTMINVSAENRQTWLDDIELYADEELTPQGSSVAWDLIQAVGKKLIDANHTKLTTLRDLLLDKHPNDKALVYTTWNNLQIPTLSRYLSDWGIEHVTYTGTAKQKQAAQDHFRQVDSCQVFLSSDAGSDSWDAEMARVGIDYNLPWKYSTRIQRWNRRNRVNSPHEFQYAYGLIMADSIEDRKAEIIARKQGYHEALYEGKVNEAAVSARMTKADLLYMIGA